MLSALLLIAGCGGGSSKFEEAATASAKPEEPIVPVVLTDLTDICPPVRNCAVHQAVQYPGCSSSGVYTINPGGTEMEAYCDMTTEGGGWTLVANYVNDGDQALNTMNLRPSSTKLPKYQGKTYGQNNHSEMGHATNALMTAIKPIAIRIHHQNSSGTQYTSTANAAALTYIKTGVGTATSLFDIHSPLTGHNTDIWLTSGPVETNQGDNAMVLLSSQKLGTVVHDVWKRACRDLGVFPDGGCGAGDVRNIITQPYRTDIASSTLSGTTTQTDDVGGTEDFDECGACVNSRGGFGEFNEPANVDVDIHNHRFIHRVWIR